MAELVWEGKYRDGEVAAALSPTTDEIVEGSAHRTRTSDALECQEVR